MLLALFPLQLALFPGEEVPLHIFEPRYKQLIAECRDEQITFGIPAYLAGNIAIYGTEVELDRILKTDDSGEMDIVVRGLRVFKIVEFQKEVPGKLYSGAKVEYPENDPATVEATQRELIERFSDLMRLVRKDAAPVLDKDEPDLSYRIGAAAGLSIQQRIHMLSLSKESDRQQFLLEHVNKAIRAVRERSAAPGRVSSNGRPRLNGGPARS